MPFTAVVSDFKQLQPVGSGEFCRKCCGCMQQVELKTVYRTTDEEHLKFLNRIREKQPDRSLLTEYYGDRHWRQQSLEECVAMGMKLAEQEQEPFSWLTCTNNGASMVCRAALSRIGVAEADLQSGYLCDPNTKSDLRIVAKPGIFVRLSRNFDKTRGFVNGAVAEVVESLDGNAVFIARLVGTGNLVLVHPITEQGARDRKSTRLNSSHT